MLGIGSSLSKPAKNFAFSQKKIKVVLELPKFTLKKKTQNSIFKMKSNTLLPVTLLL